MCSRFDEIPRHAALLVQVLPHTVTTPVAVGARSLACPNERQCMSAQFEFLGSKGHGTVP